MTGPLRSELTFSEARALPVSWCGVPDPTHVDLNGHLNHLAYLEIGTASCRPVMQGYIGFGGAYVRARGLTTFVVDQHIGYLAEVKNGETMSSNTVVHRVTERSLTVRSHLLNLDSARVAAVMDMTVVHVDVTSRRATPFPPDIRQRIERAQSDLAGALATLPQPLEWYAVHDDSWPEPA